MSLKYLYFIQVFLLNDINLVITKASGGSQMLLKLINLCLNLMTTSDQDIQPLLDESLYCLSLLLRVEEQSYDFLKIGHIHTLLKMHNVLHNNERIVEILCHLTQSARCRALIKEIGEFDIK